MKHCTVLKWNMWHFQWEATCKEELVNSKCYILNVLVICFMLSFHTFMYSPGTCVGRQLAYSLAYERRGVITWMDGVKSAMSSVLLRTWFLFLHQYITNASYGKHSHIHHAVSCPWPAVTLCHTGQVFCEEQCFCLVNDMQSKTSCSQLTWCCCYILSETTTNNWYQFVAWRSAIRLDTST